MESTRDAAICAKRATGMPLRAIGKEHGLTGERIRQIVIEQAGPSWDELCQRRILEAQRAQERLRAHCLAYLQENPGASVASLSKAVGAQQVDVRRALGADAARLTVNARPSPSTSNERLLNGLRRAAAAAGEPLSGKRYSDLERELGLVTRSRLIQRFGSWSEACRLAGVEPCPQHRVNYIRHWTRAEMEQWVIRYLMEPGSRGSYDGFTDFLRRQAGAPSSQTVRNELGRWNEIKAKALQDLLGSDR